MDKLALEKEVALRELAKRDFKTFVLLKWERYEQKPFLDNWHYDYLCKILEATLPNTHTPNLAKLGHSHDKETHEKLSNEKAEVSLRDFDCFTRQGEGATLSGSDGSRAEVIKQNHQRDNAKHRPITRLMINMPPSYGKTEIIARCFIPWALGHYPQRKFFYVSYSDDLCRKINNQVRNVLKSPFYASVFNTKPIFLQDNANEFVLREGGGLFVTTLKSALTGFHAHQILIDDPIKVSEMNSKAERTKVNTNFKESILSRLQDNQSNITILMQRLSDDDLCGYLLNPKNFDNDIISQWKQVSLPSVNEKEEVYTINDYTYIRKPQVALFPLRHTISELQNLKLQMGNDEFSTQYQQDPQVTEAGYFEKVYFKTIPSYELSEYNTYIFVDNATSLNANADNRAISVICVENHKEAVRYVLKDCFYGIWSEEQTIKTLLEAMQENPKAKVYIESEGGGLTLYRLLQVEIIKLNAILKQSSKELILNDITTYNANRKISKVEKIKALRPYYNTGFLVFLHNAKGLEQIQKELFSFNPEKPFRKDDCIDSIASALAHPEVLAPVPKIADTKTYLPKHLRHSTRRTWRI